MRYLFLFAILAGMSGCNILGAGGVISEKVFGNPNKKAVYVPLKTDPLVVLVERASPTVMSSEDAERLASLIQTQLKDHEVAPIVDSAALIDLRTASSIAAREKYANMSPAEKGQAVHAKQVLFVKMDQYQAREVIGGSPSIRAHGWVHIVDVSTGKDRWPDTFEGHQVESHGGMDTNDVPIELLATQIARLFYQWD